MEKKPFKIEISEIRFFYSNINSLNMLKLTNWQNVSGNTFPVLFSNFIFISQLSFHLGLNIFCGLMPALELIVWMPLNSVDREKHSSFRIFPVEGLNHVLRFSGFLHWSKGESNCSVCAKMDKDVKSWVTEIPTQLLVFYLVCCHFHLIIFLNQHVPNLFKALN